MTKYYKKGYPRPQFVRDSFFSLNGEWNFRFDPQNEGLKNGWQNGFEDQKIMVPFSYESEANGIGKKESCCVVWYSKSMDWALSEGKRLLLNFEGSDYRTEVWVNGTYIGAHEGGYSRFTFDITNAYADAGNTIVCRIEDPLSASQPRGKQRWMKQNYGCWYTQTTGIWKDVWAEQTDNCHVKELYLTPIYDEDALILDIKKIMEYGYNGVRKHQKIEDDRFYYWADVMGLAVWCEAPSFYDFNRHSIENANREWIEIVKQHYNHPSIIAWVPFNESWGLPRIHMDTKQQTFTESIYYLTKSLDSTRPVVSNDGWEHTKSDIITLHDYAEHGEDFLRHWSSPEDNLNGRRSFNGERYAFAKGFRYEGQPIVISEYGGIAYGKAKDAWGYGSEETSEESYLERLEGLTDAITSLDFISGYCYTQLTDVQQEQNGLMDINRRDKVDLQKVRTIFTKKK